jgi:hypothetical protein
MWGTFPYRGVSLLPPKGYVEGDQAEPEKDHGGNNVAGQGEGLCRFFLSAGIT